MQGRRLAENTWSPYLLKNHIPKRRVAASASMSMSRIGLEQNLAGSGDSRRALVDLHLQHVAANCQLAATVITDLVTDI
jgi:hypothetical protein